MDRAPGELAVADFAAARRADAAGFADREGREVVVQQECFLVGALQRIDELFVFGGAHVATTKACVSPRVNSAEPWVRGNTPTSDTICRTVFTSRPSMRLPVSRMFQRTILASSSLNTAATASLSYFGSAPSGKKCAITFFLTAATASWRSCLRTIE